MQETEKIWMNGELVDWADAKVHVGVHGLHYGSGVFEGIRCYDTPKGPAVFRLGDHMQRLHNSARLLYMQIPFSVDELSAACRVHDLVRLGDPHLLRPDRRGDRRLVGTTVTGHEREQVRTVADEDERLDDLCQLATDCLRRPARRRRPLAELLHARVDGRGPEHGRDALHRFRPLGHLSRSGTRRRRPHGAARAVRVAPPSRS